MSIADIFKIQTAYNTNGTFKDQTNWQDAFKIANAFAETSEKHRENRENLATSDWRTAYQNNFYDTGIKQNNLKVADLQRLYNNALQTDPSQIESTIAQNNFAKTSADLAKQGLQGQHEAQQYIAKYAFNADGSVRSYPEMYQAMQADGVSPQNIYAITPFINSSLQERANKQILLAGIINNSRGITYDALGNPIPTSEIIPTKLANEFNLAVAGGKFSRAEADKLYSQFVPPVQTPAQPNTALPTGGNFQQMYSNVASKTVVSPYAIGNALLGNYVNTPEPQIDPALDFRKNYGVTDNEMALVNRYMQATGMNEQEALKNLRAYFEMRRSNVHSPEKAMQLMLEEVIKAERQKRVKAQIGDYVYPNQELNRLIGNK